MICLKASLTAKPRGSGHAYLDSNLVVLELRQRAAGMMEAGLTQLHVERWTRTACAGGPFILAWSFLVSFMFCGIASCLFFLSP